MQALRTQRLRLEPLREEHASRVFEPLQDPGIYRFIPDDPPVRSALQRRYAFLEGGRSPDETELWLNWVVFLGDSTTPIGTVQATLPRGADGSFAYIVFPRYWRRGYGRELVTCLLTHVFETYTPPNMYAEIDTRNVGSIRLVESLGLVRTATTRDADVFKGASSDEYTYSISRDAWWRSFPGQSG